jgi:putative acetyltransferase
MAVWQLRLREPSLRVIRPYLPSDEDELVAVWLAATIPGQDFLQETHWRDMEPAVRHDLLPIADTWVVIEDGDMVAFMSVIGDLIGGLFTHPDHQGQGHGRSLIGVARERFDPVFVEVFEANDRALRFYRRAGFVDHERNIDPASGLPVLILRLEEPDIG